LVQGKVLSHHPMGQLIRGRAAAGAGSNRTLRSLAVFCRVGADPCSFFAPLKSKSMDAKRISLGRKTTAAAKRRDDREEIHNAASYGDFGTIGHFGQ